MPDDRAPPSPDGFAPGPPPGSAEPPIDTRILLNSDQIAPASGRTKPQLAKPSPPRDVKAGVHEVKDGVREVIETVVFVVVLVLLLKTFLAEAFVIPTGSMAPTLFGYHKDRTCEKCGYRIHVNASDEAENGRPVTSCICPNCRYRNSFQIQLPGGGP